MKASRLIVVFMVLFFVLIGAVAFAAAPQFTVTWTAPTTNTDGTPIAGAVTYQMYAGIGPGKEIKLGNPVTSPPYVIAVAPGVNECVQVTAIVNGVESDRSPEACATMPFPTPNSPTVVTITIK